MSRFTTSLRSPFSGSPSSSRSHATSDSSLPPYDNHRMHYSLQPREHMPLQLSPRRQHNMLNQIEATVDDLVGSLLGSRRGNAHWQHKGAKKDITYYVDDAVRPEQTRFCCKSETNARSEDIINLFLATDTKTLLRNNRVMHDNILEARVLSVLEEPTPEEPFKSVYIRYSSHAAPKPLKNRDLCLLVSTNVIPQDDGSTIGYCLWNSVEIPECPDYQKTRGLVRSRMFRSGFFCRTVNTPFEGTTTKIVYLVGMEPGGTASPKFAAWLLMEKFGKTLSRLCNHFRLKHLNPAAFRPRVEWTSTRNAMQCRGCTKSLHSSFTTRHNCVACGEVFCSGCYTKDKVDLPGVGLTCVRFCLYCLEARDLPPKPHGYNVSSRATLAVMQLSHGARTGFQRQRLPQNNTPYPSRLSPRSPASASSSRRDKFMAAFKWDPYRTIR